MVLILGITGATGAIYGIRLLQTLHDTSGIETHLVITSYGEKIIEHETDYKVDAIRRLANFWYEVDDLTASISSGSFLRDAMVIAPCSMKTMSALAHSYADNLIVRAADVTLKERKKLVLLARETPIHLGHIRNMLQLTEMGAIILPPIPSFYSKPKTIDDIVNHIVGRTLDLLGIDHGLVKRWSGKNR